MQPTATFSDQVTLLPSSCPPRFSIFSAWTGSLDVPAVHDYCVATIHDYFAAVNSALAELGISPRKPHDPVFMNNSTKPAYLKP